MLPIDSGPVRIKFLMGSLAVKRSVLVILLALGAFGLIAQTPALAHYRFALQYTYRQKAHVLVDKGELIVTDGDEELRSPIDGCTIFMPARVHIPGRELVYLTRPIKD